MKLRTSYVVAGLIAGVFAVGCSGAVTSVPSISPAMLAAGKTVDPATTEASLEAGMKVVSAKCKTCHTLYDPKSESESEWRLIIDRMAPRAKLTPEEKTHVLQYILAARATK